MKEENNNLNSQSEEQIEKTSIINITDDGNSNENDNINKEQVVNTNPISEVKSNIESTSNISQIKDDVIQSMNTTNVNISDQSNDIPNNLVNPETSDFDDIRNAFKVARECKGKPTMILAHTIKGKGVSYMENAANWHGVAPNEEQLKIALEELEGK